MRNFTFLSFLLFSIISYGQCPDLITIVGQSQIDNFAIDYPDCTNINSIHIGSSGNNIVNLNGLSQITSVQNTLKISGTYLLDLEGLNNVEYIYNFEIKYNTELISTSGLENIQFVFGEFDSNSSLTSIEGLANEFLTEVRRLEIRKNNYLVNLNGLDGLESIEELKIIENYSLIDLTGLENLDYIGGGLLLIENNDSLESFNGLDNVFFSHFGGNWKLIRISQNPSLTTIDSNFIAPGSTTRRIVIDYNPSLTDLQGFSNLSYLDWKLILWANTSLHDLSGLSGVVNTSIGIIDIWQNFNLENLSGLENYQIMNNNGEGLLRISNNNLTEISSIQNLHIGNLNTLIITNNQSLEICSIDNICSHIAEGGETIIYNNAVGCNDIIEIEELCIDNFNLVYGNVNFDFDMDGCDNFDYESSPLLIEVTDGLNLFTTFTDSLGYFARAINIEGTFEVRINPESLPSFFESSPINEPVTFIDFGNQEQVNFCLTTTETINDLKITMLALNEARPGFDTEYQIIYENIGTTVLSGDVILEFDDTRQSFLNAIPTQDGISGNIITWNYTNLLPFESRNINVSYNTLTPPTNEDGDVLVFEATINPVSGDENPLDNIYSLEQIIVNSQDPNDKQVMQGIDIYENEIGNYLDYIVRFQNVGTTSAINVRVDDVLSDKLNWNTLRPLSSSHSYRVEILDGNQVSFIFDDINLPAEADDPEGSNGYIAFQVKTNLDLLLGDTVTNTASIYFDFNDSVVTNIVSTQILENLGITDVNLETKISLIPNPVSETLNISFSENIVFQTATVYSILGEKIVETTEQHIDFSNFSSGIYFVEVATSQGMITKKVVKK